MSGAKPVTLATATAPLQLSQKPRAVGHYPYYMSASPVRENPIQKAASQLKLVCSNLPTRPISLWDAEYGCASFIKQTSDIAVDKLMRRRSNRLLYGAPPPDQGTGRPRLHGDKFKLNDSSTWCPPDQIIEVNDPKMGRLRIRLWQYFSDKHYVATSEPGKG